MDNPSGFGEEFENFIRNMFEHIGKDKTPKTNNPEDYEGSAKIQDDDALMLMAELHNKRQQMHKKMGEMDIIWHEEQAVKARLFRQLEEVYSSVRPADSGPGSGTAFRKWQGDWFYVDWEGAATGPQEKK